MRDAFVARGRARRKLEGQRALAAEEAARFDAQATAWSVKHAAFLAKHASQEDLTDRLEANAIAIADVKPQLQTVRATKKKLRRELWTSTDQKLYLWMYGSKKLQKHDKKALEKLRAKLYLREVKKAPRSQLAPGSKIG